MSAAPGFLVVGLCLMCAGSAASALPFGKVSAGRGMRRSLQPDTTRAAFVGNSYTFYQDLPVMLGRLAEGSGEELVTAQNTPGGSALWEHADPLIYGVETGAMLDQAEVPWNFVVLQDQSQTPGGGRVTSGNPLPPGEAKQRAITALLDFFVPRLRGARPVLYSTWGRRDGDIANLDIFPDFLAMNQLTTLGYREYERLLAPHNPLLVPAGEAFEIVWFDTVGQVRNSSSVNQTTGPSVTDAAPVHAVVPFRSLYFSEADGSHPSTAGTYLVALCFYGTLWGRSPVGLPFVPLLLPAEQADYLQQVAQRALTSAGILSH